MRGVLWYSFLSLEWFIYWSKDGLNDTVIGNITHNSTEFLTLVINILIFTCTISLNFNPN